MRRVFLALTLAAVSGVGIHLSAQSPAVRSPEPFKLGTFLIDGRPAVGVVLRDSLVVDLVAANRDLQLRPEFVQLPVPGDMLGVIGQYEYGLQRRIYEIVNALVAGNRLSGEGRAGYVHDVAKVKTLAPILYPS